MANKTVNTRIINKHDTTANWNKATNFIPKAGEIIIYDDVHRIKIGDGKTKVISLPFSESALDTSITNHINNKNNPHAVTKAQVGLSNVDNTSDASKPISTATQTALDKKADKSALSNYVTTSTLTSTISETVSSINKNIDLLEEEVNTNTTSIQGLTNNLSAKYDKTGGTISGNVNITGTLTVNSGAVFSNSTWSNGTENDVVKYRFKTTSTQYGAIYFGKEGPNSGAMIGLDQVEGTRRLNFRSSSTPGAIIWSQPESNSVVYFDVDNVNFRGATNVVVPNTLSATTIKEGGTTLADKYAAKNHTHSNYSLSTHTHTLSSLGAAAATHSHSLSQISDLQASWDAILKAAPTNYITRWPTISEVTNKTNLTISLNGGTTEGTNKFTYNGVTAKNINITPASIGAATTSHSHSYLPLSGGTLTGTLTGTTISATSFRGTSMSLTGTISGATIRGTTIYEGSATLSSKYALKTEIPEGVTASRTGKTLIIS